MKMMEEEDVDDPSTEDIEINPKQYIKINRLVKICENYNITDYDELCVSLPKKDYLFIMCGYTQQEIKECIATATRQETENAFEYIRSCYTKGLPYRYYHLKKFLESKNQQWAYERERYFENVDRFREYIITGIYFLDLIHKFNGMHFMLKDFEKIANKQKGRKGCLFFKGNSNTGKTTLANALTRNVQCSNISKIMEASEFVFGNIYNSRICHMDEAKIGKQHAEEYIKLMCANDKMLVNAKYKSNKNIKDIKPPIIATSNNHILSNAASGEQQTALNYRILKYELNILS